MTLVREAPSVPSEERDGADALFEEAHRRRRRRRWVAVAVATVAIGAVAGVVVGSGGSNPPSPVAGHGGPSGASSAITGRVRNAQPAVAPVTAGAYHIGVLGGGRSGLRVGWAINGTGVYLTTDAGRAWSDITPPSVDPAVESLGNLSAVSPDDLWLPVLSGGTLGVFRTTDGGRRWAFSPLPDCPSGCGISLSFVDAMHGFALVGPDGDSLFHLLRTADGGASWQPTSLPRNVFSTGSSIRFTTVDEGWAVTEPVDLTRTAARTPGVLWHTSDGGRTWQPAHLPRNFGYQLPTFFNQTDGVVLDYDDTARSGHPTTVFVTVDGGRIWRARAVPHDPHLRTYAGLDLPFQALPFSAATMTKWAVFVGPSLYTTSNGGRSWHRLVSTPRWPPGYVKALHLGLTGSAWVLATYAGPTCTTAPGCEHDRRQTPPRTDGRCGPTSERCRNQAVQQALLSTTDGGRTWRPLPFSPSPS